MEDLKPYIVEFEEDNIMRPNIITSEFLFSFGRLNLAFLSSEKRDEVVEKCGLVFTKVVEIFEYKKNNNSYCNKAKLYYQVMKKTLPIMEIFYLEYFFLFLFNKIISYFIYKKNIL